MALLKAEIQKLNPGCYTLSVSRNGKGQWFKENFKIIATPICFDSVKSWADKKSNEELKKQCLAIKLSAEILYGHFDGNNDLPLARKICTTFNDLLIEEAKELNKNITALLNEAKQA